MAMFGLSPVNQMTRKSNQDVERDYFDMFRQHYQLPAGELIYGDKPDIVISGERQIGIEITNFFHEKGSLPGSEQVQRKAREETVSKAQELYLAQGGKDLSFRLVLTNHIPLKINGLFPKLYPSWRKQSIGSLLGR